MEPLTLSLHSFGYQKSGIPQDNSENNGGFVFDCRALPNPGRLQEYKNLSGLDQQTIDYLQEHAVVAEFVESCRTIIELAIYQYQKMGYTQLMVSFGCTGGQHRSVYCVEQIHAFFLHKNINVKIIHHEQQEWNAQ